LDYTLGRELFQLVPAEETRWYRPGAEGAGERDQHGDRVQVSPLAFTVPEKFGLTPCEAESTAGGSAAGS
jgi:hypothetical protein